MQDEFYKCHFCNHYDDYEGCTHCWCNSQSKTEFEANKDRLIKKAKEKGISVSDVIALINL